MTPKTFQAVWWLAAAVLLPVMTHAQPPASGAQADTFEKRDGGIIRGPAASKRIALSFTGHGYAEGGEPILNELRRHHAKGSFFFTGDFLANPEFAPLVTRIVKDGHYLGPHSDKHLLFCAWEDRRTLVTREQFTADLRGNLAKLKKFGLDPDSVRLFLPAYEHYNPEIVRWAAAEGRAVINYTPGTRSNADYTGEADRNFVSSQKIFDSILAKEAADPHGLNGFILLLHIGAGPGRTDKFAARFGELLDRLAERGYEFVRVDDLLAAPAKSPAPP